MRKLLAFLGFRMDLQGVSPRRRARGITLQTAILKWAKKAGGQAAITVSCYRGQAVAMGIGRRLGPISAAGLIENVRDVAEDCVEADRQLLRDLLMLRPPAIRRRTLSFAS